MRLHFTNQRWGTDDAGTRSSAPLMPGTHPNAARGSWNRREHRAPCTLFSCTRLRQSLIITQARSEMNNS